MAEYDNHPDPIVSSDEVEDTSIKKSIKVRSLYVTSEDGTIWKIIVDNNGEWVKEEQ